MTVATCGWIVKTRTVVLKVWSTEQKQEPFLGACEKWKPQAPSRATEPESVFQQKPRDSYTYKLLEKQWSKTQGG